MRQSKYSKQDIVDMASSYKLIRIGRDYGDAIYSPSLTFIDTETSEFGQTFVYHIMYGDLSIRTNKAITVCIAQKRSDLSYKFNGTQIVKTGITFCSCIYVSKKDILDGAIAVGDYYDEYIDAEDVWLRCKDIDLRNWKVHDIYYVDMW